MGCSARGATKQLPGRQRGTVFSFVAWLVMGITSETHELNAESAFVIPHGRRPRRDLLAEAGEKNQGERSRQALRACGDDDVSQPEAPSSDRRASHGALERNSPRAPPSS